jgi:hypothetical protein
MVGSAADASFSMWRSLERQFSIAASSQALSARDMAHVYAAAGSGIVTSNAPVASIHVPNCRNPTSTAESVKRNSAKPIRLFSQNETLTTPDLFSLDRSRLRSESGDCR